MMYAEWVTRAQLEDIYPDWPHCFTFERNYKRITITLKKGKDLNVDNIEDVTIQNIEEISENSQKEQK